MSGIVQLLAEHGLMLLGGATALLLAGAVAALVVRSPVHRQRICELSVLATLAWVGLAAIPLPRVKFEHAGVRPLGWSFGEDGNFARGDGHSRGIDRQAPAGGSAHTRRDGVCRAIERSTSFHCAGGSAGARLCRGGCGLRGVVDAGSFAIVADGPPLRGGTAACAAKG